jgi:hypothetical protein
MKGIITEIGTSSKRVQAAIEEAMKNFEQPQSQHEAVQPTNWDEATKDLRDLPQREPSRENEMER